MYSAFWLRVNEIIGSSLFGRIFLWLVRSVGGAFKASWFYNFFVSKNMADVGESAKIPSFIRKLLYGSRFTAIAEKSFLIKTICSISQNVISAPVAVFSFYLIPSSLLLFIRNFGNIPYMIVFAVTFVIGLFVARFRVTVGAVVGSSFLLGNLCDFFEIKTDYGINKKPAGIYALAAIVGAAVGLVSFIFGDMIMFAAFIGCLVLPLLLDSPLLLITATVLGGVVLSTFPAFALSLLTFIVVICRVVYGKEKLPKLRPVYILTALYGIITLYHMFNGFGGSDSMLAGMIQFVLLLTFFSVVIVVNDKDRFRKFAFSVSASSIISGLYGIYQFIAGSGGTGWSDNEAYVGGLNRIVSTFANPNVYGEFLIIAICFTAISIFLSQKILERVFFIGCMLLQLINLALTYSRGCYIAVILAALIVVWCCDKRLLGFGLFAVPVLPYILPQNILTRILSVGSYLKDTSVSYRFSIWEAAIKIIRNHWYIGAGVGTVAFSAFYQDYMIPGVDAQHSHNWFMQITIELSVIALIVLLLIFFYSIKDLCYVIKNNTSLECKFMLIPLIGAVAGIFVEGFVDYIFYNNIIYMMFWILIAMLVAGLNICDKECKNEKL